MRYRVVFAAGFGAGFILGARAGRERYDQIARMARRVVDSPAVQQAAGALNAQAGELGRTAKQKVSGKLHGRTPGSHTTSAGNGRGYHPAPAMPDGSQAGH